MVVYGRLRVNQWMRQDNTHATSVEIDAYNVGHDLSWGTTSLTRVTRAQLDTHDRMADDGVQDAMAAARGRGARAARRTSPPTIRATCADPAQPRAEHDPETDDYEADARADRRGAHATGATAPRTASASSRPSDADSGVGAPADSLAPMPEFIYVMSKARKAHGDKVILDDVTISFYPGAKIGVVGPNGAGKSSVLKIMAGLDQPSNGEARLTPGYTVGILMQEPELNEEKTVLGNVEEGAGEIKAKLDRYNAISAEMAEPDADFDALMEEMGKLQEAIDAADAWDLDSQLEQAMDALRCPPPDADVTVLSGGERRRVALCKLLLQKPDLLLLDEPTNHLDAESVLWLEQHLGAYHGAVVAVTHDRYFMDNVAQWILELDRGRAYPYEGNYSTYLEKKQARLEVQGKKDAKLSKRLKEELEWVRSNAKARQVKSKARLARYEEMAAEADRTRKLDFDEIQIPPGPAPGLDRHRGQGPQEGLRRPGPHRQPVVHVAAQRDRRRDRPQRRRQDHPLQDHRRPRGGRQRLGQGRRDGQASPTSTRAAAASTPPRTSGRPSRAATTTSRSVRSRSRPGPTCRSSASRAPTSRR